MARSTTKESFWQDHIRRWQQSHLSVRAFCRTHRLREPSFYHWRRLLTQRGLLAEAQPSAPPCRHQAAETASTLPAFVPVRIEHQSVPHNAVAPAFEVVLAGGRVLRVPVDFDAAALRRLIATLEDRPC
jgi:transposase-like protein